MSMRLKMESFETTQKEVLDFLKTHFSPPPPPGSDISCIWSWLCFLCYYVFFGISSIFFVFSFCYDSFSFLLCYLTFYVLLWKRWLFMCLFMIYAISLIVNDKGGENLCYICAAIYDMCVVIWLKIYGYGYMIMDIWLMQGRTRTLVIYMFVITCSLQGEFLCKGSFHAQVVIIKKGENVEG